MDDVALLPLVAMVTARGFLLTFAQLSTTERPFYVTAAGRRHGEPVRFEGFGSTWAEALAEFREAFGEAFP